MAYEHFHIAYVKILEVCGHKVLSELLVLNANFRAMKGNILYHEYF